MKAKVLKPFKYAHDGIRVVDLAVGDEVEIVDGVVVGLVQGGFIELIGEPLNLPEGETAPELPPLTGGEEMVEGQAGTNSGDEAAASESGANAGDHADDLHIHHTGRGRWAVFDGQKRLTEEPLTKAEAEAKLAEMKAQA
jgi:hypothetical protein